MTERIYYTDQYCASFEATVIRLFELGGRPAATLDRTAFYPTSGGQPFDTGVLDGVPVVEVVDLDDGSVAHVLGGAVPQGRRVSGAIDWTRRFDHMQQHTGQHVLSAAFDRLFDLRTVSFHMSADVSTIDLAREVTPEMIEAAEQAANRVVWEDRPVTIRFASAAEAAQLRLRKEPVRAGTLRLIDIDDCDLSACGGTHVARTGAIGLIAATGWERVRGGTRLTFVCGGRALRALHRYRDSVTGSIRMLSVLPEELPSAVERLQGEARDARRTIQSLQEALADHEAARLVAQAPRAHGIALVVASLEGWDAAGLKAVAASAVRQESVALALFSSAQPLAAVVARSKDVALDAAAVLKQLSGQFGGRGGGKPDLAQAGGLDAEPARAVEIGRALLDAALSAARSGE